MFHLMASARGCQCHDDDTEWLVALGRLHVQLGEPISNGPHLVRR